MSLELYLPINPSVCHLFHAAAVDTWERIKFSRTTPRLRIHETSITQNLVYEMRLLKSKYPHWGFTLYESTNEKANGDDLELCILHNNGQVYTYAMQAKIIYHSLKRLGFEDGNYPRMNHEVGGTPQVDLLLDYSNRKGYVPLYLLYNFVTFNNNWLLREDPQIEADDVRSLGCTVISAYLLKNYFSINNGQLRGDIRFSDLHKYTLDTICCFPAMPWENLVCLFRSRDVEGLRVLWRLPEEHQIKGRDVGNIIDDPQWQQIASALEDMTGKLQQFISRVNEVSPSLQRDSAGENFPEFRPKFRLFISEK